MSNLPATVPDQLQPHNVEAEEAVIGSLLIDRSAIVRVATFLGSGDFYVARNGFIYQAILDLHDQNKPADLVTITDLLALREDGKQSQLDGVGGSAYLSGLINATPTSIHAEYYARIVERTAVLRRLIDAAAKIAQLAYQDTEHVAEVVDQAEEIIFGAVASARQQDFTSMREGLDKELDRQEEIRELGIVPGLLTGLSDLDKLLGGLQRSDMIVMAGRPGMGKTSMAISIALQAARDLAKRVAVFSLEMSDEQVVQRSISAQSGIGTQEIRLGTFDDSLWTEFIQATQDLAKVELHIDDTPAISVGELRSKARRLHADIGLDLLIIDYLQLMRGNARRYSSRQEEVSDISRNIKALAKELNVPILALSQLSRAVEGRKDKRPMLSDLRESGAVEQDSDVVIFVYRDEVYNPDTEFPNVAEIIVGKHRSGPTGIVSVYFKKHLAQFVDLIMQTTPLGGDY